MLKYFIFFSYYFSTWGESLTMLLQSLLIAYLLLFYKGHKLQAMLFVIVFVAFMFCLSLPIVPLSVHKSLQALSWPIISWGKVSYINLRNKVSIFYNSYSIEKKNINILINLLHMDNYIDHTITC